MKTITVRQPYASLIVAGIKTIETRPGPPAGDLCPRGQGVRPVPGYGIDRGQRIAIHAAAPPPEEDAQFGPYEVHECADYRWRLFRSDRPALLLPLGAIIGTVRVVAAVPIVDRWPTPGSHPHGTIYAGSSYEPYLWVDSDPQGRPIVQEIPLGEFTPDRWGWILADPELCDLVPIRGRQGVWEWDA